MGGLKWRGVLVRFFAGMMLASGAVSGGEWPQILGPTRTGIAAGETVDPSAFGQQWKVNCGSGFAGVAVDRGIVVLFDRDGDERLTALRVTDGKQLWQRTYDCSYEGQIVEDNGPRAVPTISGDRVYAYGVQGVLSCVDLAKGTLLWQRSTHKDYQAAEGYFGAACSPLVTDGLVIVNVGGPRGAGIVAFNTETGKTVWQSTSELASYSAPVITTLADKPTALVLTRLNLLGVEPKTGREMFRFPFGSRGPTVNGALPVIAGSEVLLTASYGIGARLVKLTATAPEVVWEDEILSSQYTTPIVLDGFVYGVDGRQDGGPATLKCFELKTRKLMWSKEGLTYGTLVAAGRDLLLQHTDGQLRIVALQPDRYIERGLKSLAPGTTRALPALAEGRWFLRNERSLYAFGVSGK